jgi:hypothetical protein
MRRFNIGDRVKILPVMASPFVDLVGTVDHIQPNDRNVTQLDRYVVRFEWGEKHSFYDAQLTREKASQG